jgi:tyrosine-protein kinase Etk/Wzc
MMQENPTLLTTEDKPGSAMDQPASPQKELDLFVFALLLRRNSRRILGFAIAGFFLMLILMLLAKPQYSSTAVLIVPQDKPSAGSLALKMAAGIGGLDASGGSLEIYEDILKSRTLASRLIAQYHLNEVYKTKDRVATEKALALRTLVKSSKEGLIRITVEDEDPKRATELANSYMAELDKLNQGLAITSAGQQRLYFERELIKEKNALADAEVDLQRSQEQTGMLVPDRQAQANIAAVETTRAQLRVRQVELSALLQGATEQNPRVMQLKAEIAGIENQLQAMQSGHKDELATGIPSSQVPEKSLENLRKIREVKFHETLFGLLAQQYELAKQQEAKTVSMIQVLDSAQVPEHKSWPPRTLFTLLGFLGGGVLGIFYLLIREFLYKVRSNPENQRKYHEIMKSPGTSSGGNAI